MSVRTTGKRGKYICFEGNRIFGQLTGSLALYRDSFNRKGPENPKSLVEPRGRSSNPRQDQECHPDDIRPAASLREGLVEPRGIEPLTSTMPL